MTVALGALGVTIAAIVLPAYLTGVAMSFGMGGMMRSDAQSSAKIYGRSTRTSPTWRLERLAEAREEYDRGCRRQARAMVWPLDMAYWIKSQAITAVLRQKETA